MIMCPFIDKKGQTGPLEFWILIFLIYKCFIFVNYNFNYVVYIPNILLEHPKLLF